MKYNNLFVELKLPDEWSPMKNGYDLMKVLVHENSKEYGRILQKYINAGLKVGKCKVRLNFSLVC